MGRYPLVEIDPATARHIAERGGRPMNLYRVLGNQPAILGAWIDFASALRYQCATDRGLRELVILLAARLCGSAYQWEQHLTLARKAGVPAEKIDALGDWRASQAFDDRERAALALGEAIVEGRVDDATHGAAAAVFTHAELIELTVTAGFYAMLPRVLDATGVTSEGESLD